MRRSCIALSLLLSFASGLNAQTARLNGKVVDATGAVIPAASVTIYLAGAVVRTARTSPNGNFDLELPSGFYGLEVSAPAFERFRQEVQLTVGMPSMSIAMTVASFETRIDVNDEANPVAVSIETGLGNTILTGDQLLDLPDNEDDLVSYLQQVASARGGAEQQASFIIDGFTGGRIPPRDQIQQIIIEDSPFGADTAGGGPRIRIITRPGSGEWRATMGFRFADESLDARSANAVNRPSRQQRTFSPQFGGPIVPGRATVNFSGQNAQLETQGSSIIATTPDGSVAQGVVSPTTTRSVSPRFVISGGENHRLNINFNYQTNMSSSLGGDIRFPSVGPAVPGGSSASRCRKTPRLERSSMSCGFR